MRLMSPKRLGLIAIPALFLVGCSDNNASTGPAMGGGREMPATRILAERVEFRADREQIESVGTARARLAATIYPQSSGEIVSVSFTSGQYIEEGQILARLDSAEERLRVAQANVTLQNAQQLLARYERIDVDGAISESQIDSAQTAVEAATIDLRLAEETLADRTIRAPFSGYVGLTDIDIGATVNQQTEITRIDDRTELFVDFALPEQVFGRVNVGDTLPMRPFAAAERDIEAIVAFVDSRIDADRRSFMVRASVDNSADDLRPGMSFRVEFSLPGNDYPAVPEASIVWGGDGAYLWKVVNNQAQRVPVTIVSRDNGYALVRADLSENDMIITEGVQKVRQGSAVSVVQPTANNEIPVAEIRRTITGAAVQ